MSAVIVDNTAETGNTVESQHSGSVPNIHSSRQSHGGHRQSGSLPNINSSRQSHGGHRQSGSLPKIHSSRTSQGEQIVVENAETTNGTAEIICLNPTCQDPDIDKGIDRVASQQSGPISNAHRASYSDPNITRSAETQPAASVPKNFSARASFGMCVESDWILRKISTLDSAYVKKHLGIPLSLALSEILSRRPSDPIHYLGHWLFKWRYNQEQRQMEADKVNDLLEDRRRFAEEIEEELRIIDRKKEEEKIEIHLEAGKIGRDMAYLMVAMLELPDLPDPPEPVVLEEDPMQEGLELEGTIENGEEEPLFGEALDLEGDLAPGEPAEIMEPFEDLDQPPASGQEPGVE